MKQYELTYLISQEFSGEEIKNLSQKINTLLGEEGGEISEEIKPEKKKLAYPIKKQRQAYLAVLKFAITPEGLENFFKKIKLEPQILRFLLLTKRERRVKKELSPRIAKKIEETPKMKKLPEEKKVEIEEIEKKLAEILGEI